MPYTNGDLQISDWFEAKRPDGRGKSQVSKIPNHGNVSRGGREHEEPTQLAGSMRSTAMVIRWTGYEGVSGDPDCQVGCIDEMY